MGKSHINMQKGDLFYSPDTKILRFPAIMDIPVVTENLNAYPEISNCHSWLPVIDVRVLRVLCKFQSCGSPKFCEDCQM